MERVLDMVLYTIKDPPIGDKALVVNRHLVGTAGGAAATEALDQLARSLALATSSEITRVDVLIPQDVASWSWKELLAGSLQA